MSPEFTAFLSQLGIAAIFVAAWFRETTAKDKLRVEKDAEIEKLHLSIAVMYAEQRKETLELIRDILAGRPIDTTPS